MPRSVLAHLLAAAALAILSARCLGQLPSITSVPPPIEFQTWKEVDVTDDATEYEEQFPSAVTTPFPANNTVPLRIFVPANAKGPVPVVVVLHYWGATDLRAERSLATELARKGMGAAIMTLPYHLSRTPPGHRSGDMAIQSSVVGLKQTTIQSVLDVRRSIDFLETRPEFDHSKIGICGTSLGALITALAYAIDDRIDSAAFILGGVDFAHIMWSSSVVVVQRDALRRQGYSEDRLQRELKDIEPLTYLPKRQTGGAFVIGAKYDSVIPLESTEDLIGALHDPKVLWIDTGHYGGIFVERRLMREVANYFSARFKGGSYEPPSKLYAPTLRLGIKADAPSGFDLAIGIDLIRFDSKGEGFASLLMTPRGPGIFAGRRITPVLAAGAIVTTRSVGIGILWSTVL